MTEDKNNPFASASVAAIEANDAAEQAKNPPPKPVKKKKKKKVAPGMGNKDTRTITKNIENVKEQLRNAGRTKNLKKARDLAGRMQALKEIRDSDA